ncbi:hypothetical protein I8748_29075 [Nostoc sp. CENA67]|uniref:Uncharacterized protein n=1 Tax=Amazonocrinis nigriterrae CENA67 TaxID=2794033 RepID=A0A8J7HZC7_9NOST|nr:hypothetical protein [Amazonocrinis nigriterrae]MBH8566163.1 hypothetical protein [Amazonocrinis nigriterrae CENA67]
MPRSPIDFLDEKQIPLGFVSLVRAIANYRKYRVLAVEAYFRTVLIATSFEITWFLTPGASSRETRPTHWLLSTQHSALCYISST